LEAAPIPVTVSRPNVLLLAVPWVLVALLALFAGWILWRSSHDENREVVRLDISYPKDVEPVSGLQGGVAISPDGQNLAMIGVKGGVRRLYVRHLDSSEAQEIGDTSGVNFASFSPDSKSVAFVPGSTLITRVSLTNQDRAIIAPGADLAS